MVKLLKFVGGKWTVVDYGVPALTDLYTQLGYLVETMIGPRK